MTVDDLTAVAAGDPGTLWRWWPEVVVRGAGFPAGGVLRLADGVLAAAADSMVDALGTGDADQAAWRQFRLELDRSCRETDHELRRIAASRSFRTAVTWQNHRLLDGAIEPFARSVAAGGSRHSKHRQREELLASYWQRYCVKNDSIGFFGPVGRARVTDEPASEFEPGARLVRRSEVFFETWAIDAVAAVLAARPGMREWLAPRRLPFIRIGSGPAGDTVLPPAGPPVPLTPEQGRVLRSCDGTLRVTELAAATALPLAEVVDVLELMLRRRWIAWKLELPIGPRPEHDLRAFLDGVGDPALRAAALATLDRLEAARALVAAAADAGSGAGGAADGGLAAALAGLDRVFSELTAGPSVRNEGQAYGGRTLVYLDCQRDVTVRIGQDLMAAAAPLDLLAHSARWYCWRLGGRVRDTLREVYRQAVARRGGQIDLARFWFDALRPLHHAVGAALPGISADFTARWDAVLSPGQAIRHVRRTRSELLPHVRRAFDAPAPGWAAARFFSPDVMVAARDIAAIRAGDFELVLGELHMAINTQRSHCFVTQHPEPAQLFRCLDADFPRPRLLPVLPKDGHPRLSVRTHPALARDRDFMVEIHHHTVPAGRHRLVRSGEVTVEDRAGDLVAVLPGGQAYDLLDVFSEFLMDAVIDRFRLLDDRPYAPRISIDKVVVSRERWLFDAADLGFAVDRDEASRFVAARAFARRAKLPRQAFVKAASGEKPVYVDLDSPVFVNVLAKLVRRARGGADPAARAVSFVEMLPTFDQLWLTDHAGRRYTSELRFTAVDRLNADP